MRKTILKITFNCFQGEQMHHKNIMQVDSPKKKSAGEKSITLNKHQDTWKK